MKICVDAGHGGADPGAIGRRPFELAEKVVTLAVAEALESELERRGHWVVMTRRQDRTLALDARAEFANRLAADLFVSVHANAAASVDVHGMEVFHFPGSAPGGVFAMSILARMLAAFPTHRNRGVKEANFVVLRRTRMPGVLVELEFLTHPDGLAFLSEPANRLGLAEAIAAGVPGGDPEPLMFP